MLEAYHHARDSNPFREPGQSADQQPRRRRRAAVLFRRPAGGGAIRQQTRIPPNRRRGAPKDRGRAATPARRTNAVASCACSSPRPRVEGAYYSVPCRWVGLDLTTWIGAMSSSSSPVVTKRRPLRWKSRGAPCQPRPWCGRWVADDLDAVTSCSSRDAVVGPPV